METFRSRDGWQLETSCSLTRAKAIRRQNTMGHSLFDLGLQFRLSVDIAGGRLKTVSFRVTDPTVELSSGVFDELEEHGDSFKLSGNAVDNAENLSNGKELFSIEHLSDLCIETNNCLLKYNNLSGGESRMLTIALRGLSVTKDSGKTQTRVVGLSVEDQRQRLALRTSLLVLSHEKRVTGVFVQVISDSVQTSLSMQDVAFWKLHVDSVLPVIRKIVGQSPPVAPSTPPRIPVTFSVEVASIFCDLVDADAFQSSLSVQFFEYHK
ncbi:hypothetical protein OSTOST_21623, partial [Ostertagia ostertagi]